MGKIPLRCAAISPRASFAFETHLAKSLGPHWWFHFGQALGEVVMPADFYKVGPPDDRRFDDLGLRALEHDWAVWPGESSERLMQRSQFQFCFTISASIFLAAARGKL